MSNIIRKSLNDNIMIGHKNEKGEDIIIKDQNQAITSLMTKVKKFRKLTDSNEETREEQKKMFILNTLKEDVLPHLGPNLFKKGVYICQMTKKLLNVHLKREIADDRDNYVNKRIDMPGTLISQLFKQYYKRMLNEINKFFEKKYTGDDENPINVINQIKPSTIEQGLLMDCLLEYGVFTKHEKVFLKHYKDILIYKLFHTLEELLLHLLTLVLKKL